MPKSGQLGTITQSGMFAGGMAVPSTASSVAWANITGVPASFNPTLPIAQSGITGLVAALGTKLTATQMPAQVNSVAADVPTLVADFNLLLGKLRTAGLLAP